MSTSRPPGYGGEAQAIRAGAAMLRAAEYGTLGDHLRSTYGGTQLAAGKSLGGAAFAPLRVVTEPGSDLRPACSGADPELFFPEPSDRDKRNEAEALCRRCPVRDTCADLGELEQYGVWGGEDTEQRIRARRSAARRQPVASLVALQQARRAEG